MGGNAGGYATTAIGGNHVDSVPAVIEEAMQRCGGSMRENGAWSTGEYDCKQAPLLSEKRMPHRIHALVNSMKPPCRHSLPCHFLIELRQLP